ncbi:MAG: hypothetical protein ACWA5R_10425 [bacterium]
MTDMKDIDAEFRDFKSSLISGKGRINQQLLYRLWLVGGCIMSGCIY